MRIECRVAVAVAVVVASALLVPVHAIGAPILIHASGVWNGAAPVSEWTAPGATWSFRFTTDDHPELEDVWDTGFNPVFRDFAYRLDGVLAPAAPVIALSSDASLVVSFGGGSAFQLFGPALFAGPPTAPAIRPGAYVLIGQPNTVEPYFELRGEYVQSFTGTILHVDPVAVPEPGTIGLMGISMATLYFRRSQVSRTARRSVRSCGTSASRSSVRNS
jgi:hypothetical protein